MVQSSDNQILGDILEKIKINITRLILQAKNTQALEKCNNIIKTTILFGSSLVKKIVKNLMT